MKTFDYIYLVPTNVSGDEGRKLADVYGRNIGVKDAEYITSIDNLQEFPIGIQCDFNHTISIDSPCIRFWCIGKKLEVSNDYSLRIKTV